MPTRMEEEIAYARGMSGRDGCESELRRVQLESLRWLVDLARRAGVARLIINGSFVTEVFEPNDVDCALLIGAGFPPRQGCRGGVARWPGVPGNEPGEPSGFRPAGREVLRHGPTFGSQRDGGGYPMNLQSHRELELTREKLRLLEERYKANKREQGGDEHVRELSMRSLKRLINQLKEESARFESRSSPRTNGE